MIKGFRLENVSTCYSKGRCSITIQTRKYCTACRFAKCLAVGMSPDLIRKEDLHEQCRSINKSPPKTVFKKIVTVPEPCLFNLLSADRSSLTITNWRLLSNVVHAFDIHSAVLETQKTVHLISINSRISQLNVKNSLDMLVLNYTALLSFVNCTADFRVMTNAEQCSLLQRNIHGLLVFYCLFVFRESGVFNDHHTENAVLPLYGYQNVQSTKRLALQLEHDPILVKVMLITLTFSANYFTISKEDKLIRDSFLYGTFRLFGSQNVYTELLWKYITYKYDFREAVRRFNEMIKIALDALRLASDIYHNNPIHRNLVDEVAGQYERVLKLNTSDNSPLWDKDAHMDYFY